MFPLTDKDREVLERLGFERSSVTGNWVKLFKDGPAAGTTQAVAARHHGSMHWVFYVRHKPSSGLKPISLGSPELIPSLVFAEIEGA